MRVVGVRGGESGRLKDGSQEKVGGIVIPGTLPPALPAAYPFFFDGSNRGRVIGVEQWNGIPSVLAGPSLWDEGGIGEPALFKGKPPFSVNGIRRAIASFHCHLQPSFWDLETARNSVATVSRIV